MLTSALLIDMPHGFSTREELALERIMPGVPLILAKQVHSPRVVVVTEPWAGPPPEADALVTARPGLLLGVITADCAPVLLADIEAGVAGAAHAGWRGALGGVIENTVLAMTGLGAQRDRIRAAIGPTIAQRSYEVDEAMRERFPAVADRFFAAGRPGHWQFDLPGFVARCLADAGIRAVDDLAQDTYANETRFFSFRRATHRGEATGGRQTSVIGL
jgi:polyphenol oxidase